MLFNFHILVYFPNFFLLFISNFILWLSEDLLCIFLSFYSGLFYDLACDLYWRMSHVHFGHFNFNSKNFFFYLPRKVQELGLWLSLYQKQGDVETLTLANP